jgi:hypothetical protein
VVNRRGVGYRLVDRSPAPLASHDTITGKGDGALVALRRMEAAA